MCKLKEIKSTSLVKISSSPIITKASVVEHFDEKYAICQSKFMSVHNSVKFFVDDIYLITFYFKNYDIAGFNSGTNTKVLFGRET